MSKKKVLFLLGDIWSLGKNKGMPSIYKVIEKSYMKYDITILTTDKNNYSKELPFAKIFYFKRKNIKFKNRYFQYFFTRVENLVLNVKYIIKVIKLKRKFDFDLLYSSSSVPIYATFFLKKIYKFKTIHRIYGTFLYGSLYGSINSFIDKIKKFEEVLSFKIDANKYIITDDGTSGDKVADYFKINNNKIEFLRNGVNKIEIKLTKKEIFDKYSLDIDSFYLLSVSRLVNWKRVDRIIKAMNMININNIKLLVVGDGEDKAMLEELTINNNIIFFGSINSEQVQELMSCVDLFVSMYDLSNIGNPLLEALSYNLPIITYDSGDTRSIINDKNGILISSTDEQEIVNKLQENILLLYNDENKRKSLIEHTEIFVKKHLYTWDTRIAKEIEIIEQVINEK